MAFSDYLPKRLRQSVLKTATAVELYSLLNGKMGPNVSLQIVPQAINRTREDIGTWYQALQAAQNPAMPRRNQLYKVYDQVMIDNHLTSVIQTRTLKITGTRWAVRDANGINPEKTLYLQAPWFNQYLYIFMDTLFWGHSLVEFGELVDGEFTRVQLVNRRHIRPEPGEYVIKETDSTGIKYRGTQLMDWYIEIDAGYGILYKASPMALWKKNALAAWSEFDEKFGMPFRTAKTPGRDSKRASTLGTIMKEMGSAGWAVIQDDESIELIANSTTDAYKCFDELINRCNTEMSKLVIGQTMTTDNGSSKSQATIHMEVMESIYTADLASVQYNLNYVLLPFLIKHGYPFSIDDQIVPDLSKSLSPEERIKIDQELLQHYDIDPKFIASTYDIPEDQITAKQSGGDPLGNFNMPSRAAANAKAIRVQLPDYMIKACGKCGGLVNHLQVNAAVTDRINQALINDGWNKNQTFSAEYFQFLISQYGFALDKGWGTRTTEIKYDAADHHMMAMMEANIFRFSAAKDLAMLNELNRLKMDAKDFNAFRGKATELLGKANGTWLRTEYNFTVNAAENAANYQRQISTADVLPYLQYQTAGDNRVREAHAALDNKVFRVNDPAIDYIYPPNGWNCRCHMISLPDATRGNDYLPDGNDAVGLLKQSGIDANGQSEWDRMVKGGFSINRGNSGLVFNENQFYIKNNFQQSFTVNDNGLEKFSQLRKGLEKFQPEEITAQQAREWAEKNLPEGYLVDHRKRPLKFEKIAMEQNLSVAGRQNILPHINDIVGKPDEVYFFRDQNTGTEYFRYLKFYNNTALSVLASMDKSRPLSVTSWYDIEPNKIDTLARAGMLIYKKK